MRIKAFHCVSLILSLSAICLVSACTTKPTQHEQQFSKETQDTDAQSLPSFDKKASVGNDWQVQLGKGPVRKYTRLKPAIEDEFVYAADTQGSVYKLTLENGSIDWHVRLDSPISAGVSLYEDELIIVTLDGQLKVLSQTDGEVLKSIKLPSASIARVATDESAYYVRTVDGKVSAYNRDNSELLWTYDSAMPVLTLRGTGQPILYAGLVISGMDNGKLVALDKKLGIPRWEYRLSAPDGRSEFERMVDVDGSPVLDSDMIFAVSYQGQVAAINLEGKSRWEKEASSYHHPAMALDNLYLALDNGHIKAIDRYTGQEIWLQKAFENRKLAQPVVYKSYLVTADEQGYVHVLNLLDGEVVGRKNIRVRPLHITYPNRGEAARWKPIRNLDFGIRAPLIATDNGVLVYTNAGVLTMLEIEENN